VRGLNGGEIVFRRRKGRIFFQPLGWGDKCSWKEKIEHEGSSTVIITPASKEGKYYHACVGRITFFKGEGKRAGQKEKSLTSRGESTTTKTEGITGELGQKG